MLLSIIICTYNRSDLLRICLSSLLYQTNEDCEVLVVDNNSNDNTKLTVLEFGSLKSIKYIFEKTQGLSVSRNTGMINSSGEYLLYIDDDCLLPCGYIHWVIKQIKEYSPDIMGGAIYPYYTSTKPKWFKDEYEIRKYADNSGFNNKVPVSGGNYIIKRDLLKQLGGFDTRFGMCGDTLGLGEERKVLETYKSVILQENQKIYYSLESYLYHHVPYYKMRYWYVFLRAFKAGLLSTKIHIVNDSLPDKSTKHKIEYFMQLIASLKLKKTLYDIVRMFGTYIGIYSSLLLDVLRTRKGDKNA